MIWRPSDSLYAAFMSLSRSYTINAYPLFRPFLSRTILTRSIVPKLSNSRRRSVSVAPLCNRDINNVLYGSPIACASSAGLYVSLAILNSSCFRFLRSSRRICRLTSSARVNVGSSPSSIPSPLPLTCTAASCLSRSRISATPVTLFDRTRSISFPTGRLYGRGGRGAKSFKRFWGSR